jgi:hypothetical protein
MNIKSSQIDTNYNNYLSICQNEEKHVSIEIHLLQEQSDSAEASKQILQEMLDQVTAECDAMKQKVSDLSESYSQLYSSHLQMRSDFQPTWKSGAGMYRLPELFGKAYLNRIIEPSEFTSQVLQFQPLETTPTKPDFTVSLPPIFLNLNNNLHFFLFF